jgi:putative superfamily III holin-X
MSADLPGTRGDPRDQSVSDLLKQLSEETSTLVRQELNLAKAEMTIKAKEGSKGAGMLGGAGVGGLLALGTLSATVIGLLDTAMDFWVAALIVTVIWAAVAAVLAIQGRNKLQEATPPVPEQAQRSVKEDVRWAKTQSRSARR